MADVAGKLALVAVPSATQAALRFVALAILWPLFRWRGEPRVPARVAAPLGLLGVALTFIFQNLGLARTSAMNASLLQGAVPILTLILAAAVLGERLGARRILAVIVAMIGVVVVTLSSGDGLRVPGVGDGLVLAGMGAWGTAALLPLAAAETWVAGPPTIHLESTLVTDGRP